MWCWRVVASSPRPRHLKGGGWRVRCRGGGVAGGAGADDDALAHVAAVVGVRALPARSKIHRPVPRRHLLNSKSNPNGLLVYDSGGVVDERAHTISAIGSWFGR